MKQSIGKCCCFDLYNTFDDEIGRVPIAEEFRYKVSRRWHGFEQSYGHTELPRPRLQVDRSSCRVLFLPLHPAKDLGFHKNVYFLVFFSVNCIPLFFCFCFLIQELTKIHVFKQNINNDLCEHPCSV